MAHQDIPSINKETIKSLIQTGLPAVNKAYSANPSLHTGQKPIVGIIECADSRLEGVYGSTPGNTFVFRNVGNCLISADNKDALSDEAKEYLEYAIEHLGVKEFRVVGHEKCGCMNHVHACNCVAKDHGHEGHSSPVMDKLGQRLSYATKDISEKDAPAYLAGLGLPVSNDPVANHVRAITIKHAYHQVKVAQNFIENVLHRKDVRISVDFYDLGSQTTQQNPNPKNVLYSYSENTKKFFDALLDNPLAQDAAAGKQCKRGFTPR